MQIMYRLHIGKRSEKGTKEYGRLSDVLRAVEFYLNMGELVKVETYRA